MKSNTTDRDNGSPAVFGESGRAVRPLAISIGLVFALLMLAGMLAGAVSARAGVRTVLRLAPLVHDAPMPPPLPAEIPASDRDIRPGVHPDAYFNLKFIYTDALGATGTAGADAEDLGSVRIESPEGGFGDASAIPPEFECDLQKIHGDDIDPTIDGEQKWPPPHHAPTGYYSKCPASSKIGEITIAVKPDIPLWAPMPNININGSIYMTKTPDLDGDGAPNEEVEVPAYDGISLQPSPLIPESIGDVTIKYEARTKTDYGLRFSNPVSRIEGVQIQEITFRFDGVIDADGADPVTHDHADLASHEVHMITTPTRCTPWVESIFVSGYDSNPDATHDIDGAEAGDNQGPDGTPDHTVADNSVRANANPPWCDPEDLAPFEPTVQTESSASGRGDPTGFSVRIDNPTSEGGEGQTNREQHPPQLKKIFTTLPRGLELNPAAVNAISDLVQEDRNGDGDPDFCLPEEFDRSDPDVPATCPRNAAGDNNTGTDIGDVEIVTPLLSLPQKGDIFLGNPDSDAPDRYKLYLEAAGTLRVKLEGRIFVAPDGQITSVFGDPASDRFLYQANVDHVKLDFKGGPRAPLSNPRECGNYETTVDFTPWTSPQQDNAVASDSFEIGGDCGAEPFAPKAEIDVSTKQAGAHPDLNITINRPRGDQQLKGFDLKLPSGLVGSLDAVPLCQDTEADAGQCPAASQVGTLTAEIGPGTETAQVGGKLYMAEGNSAGDVASLLAVVRAKVGPYDFGDVISRTAIRLRPDDYGIRTITADLPRRVEGIESRIQQLKIRLDGIAANGRPMITNPTSCAEKQLIAQFESFEGGQATDTVDFRATDCGTLPFQPTMSADSSSPHAGAPTGLSIEYANPPASSDSNARYAPAFKRINLTLPPGMEINPAAANAFNSLASKNRDSDPDTDACLPSEFDRSHPDVPATCPRNAAGDNNTGTDIADVEVVSPLLPVPVKGDIFLGDPGATGADRFKLLLELRGPVNVKLEGRAVPDANGQITSVFGDAAVGGSLPDLPYTNLKVTFKGGPQAPLTNPQACGSHTVSSQLTPWSTPDQAITSLSDGFNTSASCEGGFEPGFNASVSTTQATAHPDFTINVTRPDRHELIRSMRFALPAGFVGSEGAVPSCADADADSGNCPAETKVGELSVGVGSGPELARVNGELFMAKPVGAGEPASLAVKIPAKVGPYDLGNVLLRTRVFLRDADKGLDSLIVDIPRYLEGVPTRVRDLQIKLYGTVPSTGKPFMYNASSCAPSRFSAVFTSWDGTDVAGSAPYQATGCDGTSFAPGFSIKFDSGERGNTPASAFNVTLPAGDANIKKAVVSFPPGIRAHIDGLGKPCDLAARDAEACPPETQIGTVEATTPLLSVPLAGPVHLVRGTPLPGLAVYLRGPVTMRLDATQRTDSGGRLISTFDNIPDLAVSNFTINLRGGDRGILETRECPIEDGPMRAVFESHSGKTHQVASDLKLDPCAKATASKPSFRITRSKSGLGFRLSIKQPEGGPNISGANITLPMGLKLQKTRNWKQAWRKLVGGTATGPGCGAKTRMLAGGSHVVPRGVSQVIVKPSCNVRALVVSARAGTVLIPASIKRKLKTSIKRCNRRKGATRRKCITRLAPTFRATILQDGKDRTVKARISASRAAR